MAFSGKVTGLLSIYIVSLGDHSGYGPNQWDDVMLQGHLSLAEHIHRMMPKSEPYVYIYIQYLLKIFLQHNFHFEEIKNKANLRDLKAATGL